MLKEKSFFMGRREWFVVQQGKYAEDATQGMVAEVQFHYIISPGKAQRADVSTHRRPSLKDRLFFYV